jgi:hypothetical protein
MRTRTVAAVVIACACGPKAPPLDGDGSADDTRGSDEDPSASASVEDGPGPGGDVDGNPTVDPLDGGDDLDIGDGGDDSSGGPSDLCDHAPSGLEPGTALWELFTPGMTAGDVVVTEYGIAMSGSYEMHATIAGVNGVRDWSAIWDAPDAVESVARQLVALKDGIVVAGIEGTPFAGACADCRTRWLVAFDDTGDPQWDLQIVGGPWAIAATPSGTIAVIETLYWQDEGYITTLWEVDADGVVVRTIGTHDADVGSPTHVVVGPSGNVTAIGTPYGGGDGGWLAAWTPDYAFTSLIGGDDDFLGLALASNGDVIVPEGEVGGSTVLFRRLFDGGIVWDVALASAPRDVAVDCNDDIVLAAGGVTRLDPNGAPLWETPVHGDAVAVAVDLDGDVVVLAQSDDGARLAELAGS